MRLSKKRVEEVAEKLFYAWMGSDFLSWNACICQPSFRRVAKVTLLELHPQLKAAVRWPKPATLLRGVQAKSNKAKSCKPVGGKKVCR